MAKKIQKDTILTVAGIAIALCAFLGAGFAVSKMIGLKNTDDTTTTTYSRPTTQAPVLHYQGKDYQKRENIEVILVMGIDDRKDYSQSEFAINNSQADVLYVFAIDHDNKTYQAIQLNRDTMTSVQTYASDGRKNTIVNMQLCLAHSYGKNDQGRCLNTAEAVSELLFGVPVDHYISLNMKSIPVLNDQVGGVTVEVPAGLEKADPAFVAGAKVKLQGDQAEKFVRSRMSLENDSNDFRMERQQIFLNAWKNQVNEKMSKDSEFALNLVFALSEYMVSDLTADGLNNFANQLKEYTDLGTIKTTGETIETDDGREFHVDYDDLQKKVIDMFYKEAINEQ